MSRTRRYVAKDSGDKDARAIRAARREAKRFSTRADRHSTKVQLRSHA